MATFAIDGLWEHMQACRIEEGAARENYAQGYCLQHNSMDQAMGTVRAQVQKPCTDGNEAHANLFWGVFWVPY